MQKVGARGSQTLAAVHSFLGTPQRAPASPNPSNRDFDVALASNLQPDSGTLFSTRPSRARILDRIACFAHIGLGVLWLWLAGAERLGGLGDSARAYTDGKLACVW